MEYLLRNGKKVLIRKPRVEDAEAIVNIITIADKKVCWTYNYQKIKGYEEKSK